MLKVNSKSTATPAHSIVIVRLSTILMSRFMMFRTSVYVTGLTLTPLNMLVYSKYDT